MGSRWVGVTLLAFILGSGVVAKGGEAAKVAAPGSIGDMTLHVVPQAHIDLAWWWRYDPETLHVVATHTLETVFGNMEKYPDYTFTYLQVPVIEPLEEAYPQLFYKLRHYAHRSNAIGERLPNPNASNAKGRLAIGSASYCEFDGSLPCGESLVRQFVYGKRYFLREFGIDVKTAWVQDAWTHPWTLPQILKKCGVDSYMFSRPRGEGEDMFWWEAPDGSRVFAYKPIDVGGDSLPPQEEIGARLSQIKRKYGAKDGITLIGEGNHGGGAIRADIERMHDLMAQRATAKDPSAMPPEMKFSTPARFVDAVMSEPHDFSVVNSELVPTIRGAYTSVGEIKKGNRHSESALMTLEKFEAIASWLDGRAYPQAAIYDAWKKVMLNQFHDTISGTDILPSVDDALGRYKDIATMAQFELDACLKALCARIDTLGKGTPLVVFNPLAWERTDAVEFEFECETAPASFDARDNDGKRYHVQIVRDAPRAGGRTVTGVFLAHGVPSLGYKVFWIVPGPESRAQSSSLKCDAHEIENEFFRVRIDPATGCVKSVYDKEQKREALAEGGRGNLVQILEDFGDSEGFLKSADGKAEHNVWTGQSWDVDSAPQIALVERGPVRTTIEIKKQFELARFTQRVVLYAATRKVDFELAVNWRGTNKMVKVSFPLGVTSPEGTYEIPYGTIRRPSIGEEQVAQNWVDVSDSGYGVSLLNDSRYGHDITPNTIRLSVLRSPTAPVYSTDEGGVHEVKYSLVPHAGSWKDAGIVRKGLDLNNPLIAVRDTAHKGDLPAACAFVTVAPEGVVLSVLKRAEDSDDLIARCYDAAGAGATVRVTLAEPLAVDAVHATDLLENDQREVAVADSGFTAEVPACSIETYKLIRDPR
ncbi:MAG: glycoside hydrolase family 38 C-terminal domain-containing protein [Candidatus Hydrogenedentales bacterium]